MDCLNLPPEKNKALREALNAMKPKRNKGYVPVEGKGIDIVSKGEVAIQKLIEVTPGGLKAKLAPKTIKKWLLRQGVSEDEIRLLLKSELQGEEKLSLEMYLMDIRQSKITNRYNNNPNYRKIIKKYDNPRFYGEAIFNSRNHKSPDGQHFEDALGWSRTHIDTKNGEDVFVLDEFQSDWAQGKYKESFPISYSKFKQLAIVRAIDDAMKEGINKVIIPIERSGDLAGTEKVTEMYRELGKGILPKLKEQLKRSGLDIDFKHLNRGGEDEHWEIAISKQKGKNKVRWDMLGVLGALGLGGYEGRSNGKQ